jgi:hypothetical protein
LNIEPDLRGDVEGGPEFEIHITEVSVERVGRRCDLDPLQQGHEIARGARALGSDHNKAMMGNWMIQILVLKMALRAFLPAGFGF